MADTSVKFVITLEPDDAEIQDKINKAVDAKLAKSKTPRSKSRGGKKKKSSSGNGNRGKRVDGENSEFGDDGYGDDGYDDDIGHTSRRAEGGSDVNNGGTLVSGSGLISTYGYGNEAKKHYKAPKEPKRILPETSAAPFTYDTGLGFGGSQYVTPRGFQQEKVNRRGNIRRNSSDDASSVAGIQPASIKQQLKDLQNSVDYQRGMTNRMLASISKIGGGISGGSGQVAQLVSNPEQFIGDKLLSTITKAGPQGAIIGAIVTMIASSPLIFELAKDIIIALSAKGGPLNRDFIINVEDAVTGFLSYSDQHKRELGISSFIVSQVNGFAPIGGTDVYNSKFEKDQFRISRFATGDKP